MSGKSKLGCTTCRQRKVKYDETLPICRRCLTSRRHCDGPFRNKFVLTHPSTISNSKTRCIDITSVTLRQRFPLLPDLNATESRSFDYFLHKVAPTLAGELDASFWTILLPQISRENRAVRYAVLSTSQLFEDPPSQDTDHVELPKSSSDLAHQWDAQSLSNFRSTIDHLPAKARYDLLLLSCILFINIEFQQGNVFNACKLLKSGLSMVNTLQLVGHDANLNVLIRMLDRQRVLATLTGYLQQDIQDERYIRASQTGQCSPDILVNARQDLFIRLNDAISLMRIIRTAEEMDQEIHSFKAKQGQVLQSLDLWHRDFCYLFRQNNSFSNVTSRTLIMYYEIAKVFASVCLGPELDADKHMATFARIIDLAEEIIQLKADPKSSPPSYTFELGVILPLFFTGWKCRDWILRTKALHLLSSGPAREALICADTHARALKKIIQIERELTCTVQVVSQDDTHQRPPENCRIRGLVVHYETWEGKKVRPLLIYDLSRHGQTSEFVQYTVAI